MGNPKIRLMMKKGCRVIWLLGLCLGMLVAWGQEPAEPETPMTSAQAVTEEKADAVQDMLSVTSTEEQEPAAAEDDMTAVLKLLGTLFLYIVGTCLALAVVPIMVQKAQENKQKKTPDDGISPRG